LFRKIANMSLQLKIALAFMAMVLLILSFLGTIFFYNTSDAIKQSKQNEMNTIAVETADKVARFIFERSADIEVLSDSKILASAGISADIRTDYLENVIEAYKTYEGIFITDPDGRIALTVGETPDTGELRELISLERPYISGVTTDASGEKAMVFSRPLYDGNGIRTGIVATFMNLDSIEAIVDNVRIGETGRAELSQSVKPEEEDGMLHVRVSVSDLKSDGPAWHIDVYQEESEAFKIIDDFSKYLLLVSIVAFILFCFLSIILSRIITEPIRNLMDKMSRMHMPEGNADAGTGHAGANEIKSLQASFNSLLEQLNFMMQMVLEKTGEAANISEIEAGMRNLFENTPNGIMTIDAEGKITSLNKTAAGTLGLEASGEPVFIFSKENAAYADFFGILAQSLREGKKYSGEVCLISREGEEAVPVVFNTLRQTDPNGRLIGMTVVMNLLSDKLKREESVLRARRLSELGHMASGMAHEVRNPLASIKGYAQCARLEFGEEEQIYRDLTVILNEVERLDWIIERFMNFARPDTPHKNMTRMSDLIVETIQLMKNDFLNSGIRVQYVKGKGYDSEVPADADQIKQVLINILLNAVQASAKGQEIRVTTGCVDNEDNYLIEIADQGAGIREDAMEHIFDPFYTTKDKGSGLGLSISLRIIENHGGTLEVRDGTAGGATVAIRLPLKGEYGDEHENPDS